MAVFLGIDVGTSATKVLAINERGRVLAQDSQAYPLEQPQPLWTQQHPDHWWNATVKAVQTVVKKAKLKPAAVKAIGLSGQMHGSVFVDSRGKVIRPAILWNDQRTARECEEIERKAGGREALVRLVANPALTGFTAPKILWLRKHERAAYDRLATVLLPKDEIRRRLTGQLATDVSDASGTLLFDVVKRRWSTDLCSKLGIDTGLLPRAHESHEVTGTLTDAVAKQLGLSPECMVVAGAGDCAAGAVGCGIVRSGLMWTSIGTSGVAFVHTDRPQVDPQGRLHTFCHAVAGKWHMMGVNLSSGGSLEWFRETLCAAETKAAGGAKKVFDALTKEAARVPAGAQGLYFLPYLAGERTPHADPLARACFIGLTGAHTRGHMVRAVLEGVTYALKESVTIARELGVPIKQVRASGGGAKSPLWRSIQAAVLGHEIVTLEAEEGPAYGVALLAAVGAGTFRTIEEACRATIKEADHTPPDRREHVEYERRFAEYRRLYQSLREDFQRIASIESHS